MTGGFEGNGRQRVVKVEDAGRLIVLGQTVRCLSFFSSKSKIKGSGSQIP